MKKLLLSLFALGLITQAVPVLADNHSSGKGEMFEKHDTNGDGSISKGEFMGHAEERFKKMDLDGDGSVTREEQKSAKEKMREKRNDRKQYRQDKRDVN